MSSIFTTLLGKVGLLAMSVLFCIIVRNNRILYCTCNGSCNWLTMLELIDYHRHHLTIRYISLVYHLIVGLDRYTINVYQFVVDIDIRSKIDYHWLSDDCRSGPIHY